VAIEEESIPYEPAVLRGERLLVLAPHPDDEVIGCGGLVAQHLREGRKVRVAVVTNGAEAGDAIAREDESRRGLALLGEGLELEFYRFPDRHLAGRPDELLAKLHATILDFSPDLIAAPSPVEIHPDHLALSRTFCELVQREATLFADAGYARVAFYEVSQPMRPNTLVDISDVAAPKYAAIAAHESQLALRDYAAFARGLNAYRAMTLPPGTAFAEGYWTIALPELRITPFSALQQLVGGARAVEVTRERLSIAVVIRTKDRPALLREAIASVRANGYAEEIVVVNDGGTRPELDGITLIHHETSRGRSEAANAGVRAAGSPFVAFLDDDDLYYPEHLATLAGAAAQAPNKSAWYTDALSAFLRVGESGAYETYSRQRIFSEDFDRDLLLADNYIPLPTVLFRRDSFLDLGGFDRDFDLFEDWDLLIRLAQRGDFVHIPRLTCEIRHFEGGSSITLAAPEGSETFREAKLRVWKKHAVTLDVLARAFEKQKRRGVANFSSLVEEKGRRHHAETDLARLEREKQQLIAELGRVTAVAQELQAECAKLAPLEALARELHAQRESHATRNLALEQRGAELERDIAEQTTSISALYAEVHRLQGVLDAIYGSRTWKLHSIVQKVKGRG
jgi:LmbE family N-acetylglucosaminyl deacetylase/glycosyltransferase involved in cell wall biosynthesis